MLVAYDELDLEPGRAQLKFDGGHGGHNGMRDVVQCVGKAFWRLRLGIGHPGKGRRDQVVNYVLRAASTEEESEILDAIAAAIDVLPVFLEQGAERAMTRLHSRGVEPRPYKNGRRAGLEQGVARVSIKCGIVGLPNVGKSTLFNALTASEIPAENYPFCTIDPNIGIVNVPDPQLLALADIVQPKKVVPTFVEFVDIAGLVKGASAGEGLGNQFLAHIRETHAIAHLVRCFSSDDVTHVSGQIDPIQDIEVINTELLLADLETVEKAFDKAVRHGESQRQGRGHLARSVAAGAVRARSRGSRQGSRVRMAGQDVAGNEFTSLRRSP